jgi:hypothetical protein
MYSVGRTPAVKVPGGRRVAISECCEIFAGTTVALELLHCLIYEPAHRAFMTRQTRQAVTSDIDDLVGIDAFAGRDVRGRERMARADFPQVF